jgi:S1-C subfamily serine protease
MGISALTLTPSLAADVGLSVTEGVLIYRVWAGTPAADAGLQKNDVIVALDGETITSRDQLIKTIRSHKVGDEIRVTIVRDGETLVVPLKLAEMPRQ